MMGRWMLVVTVLAGAGQVAAADAPSNLVTDYAILGLKEVTLRGRVNVLSGDVGCNATDGSDFVVNRFKRMTYDAVTGQVTKTEEVLP